MVAFQPFENKLLSGRARLDDEAVLPPEEDACACAPVGPVESYSPLFERLRARMVNEDVRAVEERSGALELYRALLAQPPQQREDFLDAEPRSGNYALAEMLLAASHDLADHDAATSVDLARLALAVVDRLDPNRYGSGLVADLKARAWAYVGDAWRTGANPTAAQEAFRLAESHLRRGSGDPLEEAEVLSLAAGLLGDEGETSRALEYLDRATTLFLEARDTRSLAFALIRKGRLFAKTDRATEAIEFLRAGLQLLDPGDSPRFLAEVRGELARGLLSLDRAEEAWEEIGRARMTGEALLDPRVASRLTWIEGRVARAMGLESEAEQRLRHARDQALLLGQGGDAALAHLDLAELFSRRPHAERKAGFGELVRETPRVLSSPGLERCAATVVLLVQQAADKNVLEPGLVAELSRLLERTG